MVKRHWKSGPGPTIGLVMMIAAVPAFFGGLVQSAVAEDFKVAVLLPGSIQDYGYNQMGKRALDMIEKELGVETVYTENVPVANQLDVYREYAAQGYDLVVGWGGQFTDGAIQVSGDFPDTDFLIVNGGNSNGTNLGSMDPNVHEWAYIGGYLMGRLSKSGVIGFVGGMCFPATVKNLDGIEQGAKKANPDIKVLYTWTGSFEDPIKAKQASESMIEQGADVLTGNLNAGWFGVFKAAKEAGNIPCVTEWVDNRDLAPEVVVSSILKDQARFVVDFARGSKNGTFPAEFRADKLTPEMGPAILKTDRIPSDVYDAAMKIQDQLMKGEITVNVGDCR